MVVSSFDTHGLGESGVFWSGETREGLMKRRKRYQIVVLREDGKQYHNSVLQWFQLRKFMTVFLSIAVGLLIGTVGFFVMTLWHGNLVASNFSLLKQEKELRLSVDALEQTLDMARGKLGDSELELSRLETLARKENLKIPQDALGVGGAAPEGVVSSSLDIPSNDPQVLNLARGIQELEGQANLVSRQTQDISGTLLPHLEKLSRSPSIWPTKGFISSRFGTRQDPVNGRMSYHEGVDISAPKGTPVIAPAKGLVVFVGWKTGYGKTVEVSHGGGILTRYAHLTQSLVTAGQAVDRYEKVGLVGSTGRSTGTHLHYEVRVNGVPRNPKRYLLY